MSLPDAAVVLEAKDALAREFAPPTGYTWSGTPVEKMSRKALIEALDILNGDLSTNGYETHEELVRKLILAGRREGIYSHDRKYYASKR